MKKIAIIYYSKTGNTQAMARFIEEGAKTESGVQVDMERIEDFPAKKALEYDGLIIGSPTYYGSMAHLIKKFLDETVEFHGKLSGKVGAAFSSAANIGGGNETTILSIINALLIHGMIVQGDHNGDHYGPVSVGTPDGRVEKQCRTLGKKIAVLVKKI
jgi:NAD(P)H dehydrogenase (quinone)